MESHIVAMSLKTKQSRSKGEALSTDMQVYFHGFICLIEDLNF